MTINKTLKVATVALSSALFLAACDAPPPESVQRGPAGTGMVLIYNGDDLDNVVANNTVPEASPQLPAGGPKASEIYQNVEVLGDLSIGQFTRLMTSITEWVSPEEGCNYCHVAEGFHLDTKYTKKVARVMLAMTQRANQDYGDHVGNAGGNVLHLPPREKHPRVRLDDRSWRSSCSRHYNCNAEHRLRSCGQYLATV